MKNSIKLTTWLVGGLFTFSSCTDLDVDLKSTYTEYPDSEIAKEAKMAGLYYGFGGALGRRYMEAALLSSDEFMAVTFGGNWYDGGNYIHSSLHASPFQETHTWTGPVIFRLQSQSAIKQFLTWVERMKTMPNKKP